MSAAEEAVRLLGNLGDADRRWILDRLPASARARLADHVEEASRTTGPSADREPVFTPPGREPSLGAVNDDDFEWSRCVARLSTASPTSLAQSLQSEPAWLVDALLRATDWPWSQAVRKNLPAGLRADLATVERERLRLGRPATLALLRELADRSADWPPEPPRPTGLRSLMQRMRERLGR